LSLTAVILAGLALLGVAPHAAAQTAPRDPVSAQNFVPAPGRGNYLMVEGAQTSGHLTPAVGLTLDYAHQPFVLRTATCPDGDLSNCDVSGTRSILTEYIATANLTGALTLFERLQIGLVLPLSISSGESFQIMRALPEIITQGGTSGGIGDLRITAKVRILGTGEGLSVSASAWGTVPLAGVTAEDSFIGNPGPTFGGHVIGEFVKNGFHVGANVGGFWREEGLFLSTKVGPRLTYGLALAYDVTPLISVLGEVVGSSSFTAEVDENAVEARLAGRITVGDFAFTLGAGPGLVQGVGVPVFRVLGGAAWAPSRGDSDGDGVIDQDDACANEPEDLDDFDDTDGCPEADNDNDGFPDESDRCRDEAEDRDNHEDTDGCPDRDNDGDGVQDGYDSCPDAPEDMDGDRDEDGCPESDRDRDNIPDATDRCPEVAEDTDGYGDEDGCPETDFDNDGLLDDADACPDQAENFNRFEDDDGCPDESPDTDGDGIADAVDRCPREAETLNGQADDDGCPDGRALVRVEGNTITLLQQVNFRTSSAVIEGAQSFLILDVVADVLRHQPTYGHVRIEGHTDNRGDHDANVALSQGRAQACLDYLVSKGIARERLAAQGFGPDRPLDNGRGRAAEARNRRVEFIVETTAPSTAAPAAPATAAPTPAPTPAASAPAASAPAPSAPAPSATAAEPTP
jgi:outer membrane protein OmpA-like peptidoglycan-associated protein